jgi:hypothetical protein
MKYGRKDKACVPSAKSMRKESHTQNVDCILLITHSSDTTTHGWIDKLQYPCDETMAELFPG